ncbi:MAG TPA: hypothetical protein VF719_04175 [Abditibacteriaceae bacterium]|jgi:hypothetical protein
MKLDVLCDELLDALQQYDESILPLGLYSSNDLVLAGKAKPPLAEWHDGIVPHLRSLAFKGRSIKMNRSYSYSLENKEAGTVHLSIVKYSKIKVRQYGSGYHVDMHENRDERWEALDISGHLSALWKQPDVYTTIYKAQARMFLLIGFDKAQRPLERELNSLQTILRPEDKNVVFRTRHWPDRAGRGFGIRLAVWAREVGND